MSVGIYKIENLINHKVYIGQSVRIERRFAEHCRENKTMIDQDIQRYGKNNFSFTVLENCTREELNEKEKQYILQFNSIAPNGYNITSGGNSCHESFHNLDKNQIKLIRDDLINSNLSFEDLGKKYNITSRAIRMINDGSTHFSDEYIYPLREVADLSKKHYYCIDCGCEIDKKATRCSKCDHLRQRKVERPDREELKELIRNNTFSSIGRMYGVSDNTIRKWCKAENLPYKSSEIKKYSNDEWTQI